MPAIANSSKKVTERAITTTIGNYFIDNKVVKIISSGSYFKKMYGNCTKDVRQLPKRCTAFN